MLIITNKKGEPAASVRQPVPMIRPIMRDVSLTTSMLARVPASRVSQRLAVGPRYRTLVLLFLLEKRENVSLLLSGH